MRFCSRCGTKMNEVLSFSTDKRQRYNTCSKCRNETLKNKLTDKELDERFRNGIHKQNEYQAKRR